MCAIWTSFCIRIDEIFTRHFAPTQRDVEMQIRCIGHRGVLNDYFAAREQTEKMNTARKR